MSEVSPYIDEHKQLLLQENPGQTEAWLAKQHMQRFNTWFQDRINQLSTPTSDLIRKLVANPIYTITIYEGYDINGYTFYTVAKD